MLSILTETELGMVEVPVSSGLIWGMLASICAITAVFYVLRSLALFVMAKKAGISYAYVSWIPFAWIYILGKLSGDARFFGSKIKNFALFLTIAFCVAEVTSILYYILCYYPVVGYYLQGGKVYLVESVGAPSGLRAYFASAEANIYVGNDFLMPYSNLGVVEVFANILYYVHYVFDIINIVFLITAYVGIFKKYFPNHYFAATVMSVIGLFAPFIFAVRNNNPVDYNDYMRARYANYYGNNFTGGQNVNNPYGQNTQNNGYQKSPFEDFEENKNSSSSNNDPFEEFDDNKDDK